MEITPNCSLISRGYVKSGKTETTLRHFIKYQEFSHPILVHRRVSQNITTARPIGAVPIRR
jgi:hypothetical protein